VGCRTCLFCRATKNPALLDAAEMLSRGGESVAVVSRRTGLSVAVVGYTKRALGLPVRQYVRKETVADKVVQLRGVGTPFLEISRLTGASYKTVRKLGGAPKPLWGGRSRGEVKAEVGVLLEGGCSHQEVHKTLGVAPKTIRDWFPGTAHTKLQVADRARLAQFERRLNLV